MKRVLKFSLPLVLIVILGGSWWLVSAQKAPAQTPQPIAKPKPKTTPHYQPLTLTELNHDPKLTACSLIYYAVKHSKIQRWQEVADFKLGWQLDQYPTENGIKSLVWPDKQIKANAKQLQPNWFALSKTGNVTYHSFIVHSFRDDMTLTTTLPKVIQQLNQDHAATKVRQLRSSLVIIAHQKTAN